MSFRRNLIIAVIFLAIGAIYFAISSLQSKKEKQKEIEARLFLEPTDKIIAFDLENENGKFSLEKKGEDWFIISPIQAKADKDTVEVMLSNLSGAKKSNIFEAEELKPYGLAEPKAQINLEFAEPKKKIALLFGNESTSPGNFFSKLAEEKEIFTVASYVHNNMLKKLFDLRDKTVLACEPDQCTSFTLTNSLGIVAGAKDAEGNWRLSKPLAYAGDKDEISDLLRKVNFAKVSEFVDQTTESLAIYGLDKPQIIFTAVTKGKDEKTTSSTLLIGKKKEADYYAKRIAEPQLFVIKSELYDTLNQAPQKFRNARLFSINTVDVDKIEITKDEQKTELVKGAELKWEFADDKTTRCDQDKVSSMLAQIISAKADSFVADYPKSWAEYWLDNPRVKFVVADKEANKIETIYLSQKNEGEKGTYARKSGEDTVLGISSAVFDAAAKTKNDLIDKRLFPDVVRDDVQRIELNEAGKSYILQREELNWEIGQISEKKEEKGRFYPVEIAKVNLLLDNVLKLKYKTKLTPEEAKPELTQLDKPTDSIILLNKDNKQLAELHLGTTAKEETFVSSGKDKTFTVPHAEIKDILDAFASLKESLK